MHILFICDYYQPLGGTEQYLLSVSQALEASQHRVSVLYGIQSGGTPVDKNRAAYFFPEIVRRDGSLSDNARRSLAEVLESLRPDAVYIQNVPNDGLIEAVSARLPSFRFIHDHRFFCPKGDKLFLISRRTCDRPFGIGCYLNTLWRGCLHPFPHISLPLIRGLRRSLKRHRHVRLIVASSYMRRCLLSNGIASSAIETIPYFSSVPPPNRPVFNNQVLFVGRVIRQKGLLQLIQSMPNWPEGLNLLAAGDGPAMPQVLKAVESHKLGRRVRFLGNLPNIELRRHYEQCLCVAVPSLWDEPFGIVGIEAMSHAKPVVAFNVGGIPDWLIHGQTGYLAPPRDFAAFSDHIRKLHENRYAARRLGENGRQIYRERYTPGRHIERLLRVFESALRQAEGATSQAIES